MNEFQHETPLLRSLKIQSRVVGALLMREILTRFGRHNIGFLWMFLEPMMFTLGVVGLWTVTKAAHGSNLPITPFAITGYSSVLMWRNCANRCALAIIPNQSLLYHRNVRVIDLLLARLLLEIAGASMSFIILNLVFMALGLMEPPQDALKMTIAWTHLALFGMALGFCIGALSERSEAVDRVWHTMVYLLFPLSGAVFMVDWLPKQFQEVVLWLPMVHGTEMLRSGYFGSTVVAHYDLGYMITCDLILMLVGLFLVLDMGKRVEPE